MKRKKMLIILLPICLISLSLTTCGEFYDFDHDNINDPQYPRGTLQGIAQLQWESDHSGIKVSLSEPGYTAITNMFGIFEITGIPAGKSYALTASKEGFINAASSVAVSANKETDLGVILLESELGRIEGKVTKEGAEAHWGIDVSLVGYGYLNAVTSPDGSYVISNVPTDEPHTIFATSAPPYREAYSPDTVMVPPGGTAVAPSFELPKPPISPIAMDATPINSSAIAVYWSPNTDADLQGYNVHYGVYTVTNTSLICPDDYVKENTELIGKNEFETFVVNGLTKGYLYSFKITAVDNTDLESDCSERQIDQFIFPRPAAQSRLELAGSINNASGLAISNDGGKIFVTSLNGVYVYGTTSAPQQLGYILFSNSPIRIAMNPADDTKAYVLDVNGDISTIDTGALTIVAPVINTGSTDPRDIIVSTDGSFIFFSDMSSWAVSIYNATSGTEDLSSPIIYSGSDPAGLAIANDKLYIVDELASFVSIIDISDILVSGWIELYTIDVGTIPYWATVSSNGYLYVANVFSANVTVINTSDDTVEKTIDVGLGPGGDSSFGSRGIVASGNIVYVINKGDSNLSIISAITNEVISCTIPNGCPSSTPMDASEIVVTPDGNRIYISDNFGNNVKIYDYSYDLTP